MDKIQFWCERCQKKYWIDDPVYCINRRIQAKPPFLDHESSKGKIKPLFENYKSMSKCKHCGFLMREIHPDETTTN
jgi:hypothetical protein